MLKSVLKAIIEKFGYQIRRQDEFDILMPLAEIGYEGEAEARMNIERVRAKTMVAYVCLVSLWQQIRHCEENKIEGDYVECGVWKGGSVGLMALANLAYGARRRRIHMFDVFDDICEPDPAVDGERAISETERFSGRDRSTITGKLSSVTGIYEHLGGPGDLDEVKRFIEGDIGYDPAQCVYHKGWFQDTLPNAEIDKIAVLRLDGDWYASTKICLEMLHDKVVPGGLIIIDDYGCYEGCRKAVDEFLQSRRLKVFLNHVNKDCRYWVKP